MRGVTRVTVNKLGNTSQLITWICKVTSNYMYRINVVVRKSKEEEEMEIRKYSPKNRLSVIVIGPKKAVSVDPWCYRQVDYST